jgi:hypothetical protein
MRKPVRMTADEYQELRDEDGGVCLVCGAGTYGGVELALLCGYVEIVEDEEVSDDDLD